MHVKKNLFIKLMKKIKINLTLNTQGMNRAQADHNSPPLKAEQRLPSDLESKLKSHKTL